MVVGFQQCASFCGKVICPLITTKVLSEYLVEKQQKFYLTNCPSWILWTNEFLFCRTQWRKKLTCWSLHCQYYSFHFCKILWKPQNDTISIWFDNIFHTFIIFQNTLKEEKNLLELALPMSEFVVGELEYFYESENVELYF